MAKRLGYGDKWPTYAAQERGENPLPEPMAVKIRSLGFQGSLPQEEAATPPSEASVSRDEFFERYGTLKGRIEGLEKQIEGLVESIAGLQSRLPPRPHPKELGR